MTGQLPRDQIIERALDAGFDVAGFAPAGLSADKGDGLKEFVSAGHHGEMGWIENRMHQRISPDALWDGAKSVLMLGMNYGPASDPRLLLQEKDYGNISVYARGKDYHDVIKKRLKAIARWIVETYGCELKVFVDTAPVMEKPLASRAGLGWQGKHTNMVSPEFGSWLFLGAIMIGMDVDADTGHRDQCGSCTACLDACPTDAFPAPYKIDARKCISYLTIELKEPIPLEYRKAMGNRIYGCDDCLAACPWNKFAQKASESSFFAKAELGAPSLDALAAMSDTEFRTVFSGSPIKRIGRAKFVSNVLIAIGNSGNTAYLPQVNRLKGDESPLVQDAAQWAEAELAAIQ